MPAHISPSDLIEREFHNQITLSPRALERLAEYDQVFLSVHSNERKQQRGISELQIALVLLFGHSAPAKNSERTFYFNQASRRELHRALGSQYSRISDRLDYYVIFDPIEKEVRTCAHRIKRRRT